MEGLQWCVILKKELLLAATAGAHAELTYTLAHVLKLCILEVRSTRFQKGLLLLCTECPRAQLAPREEGTSQIHEHYRM